MTLTARDFIINIKYKAFDNYVALIEKNSLRIRHIATEEQKEYEQEFVNTLRVLGEEAAGEAIQIRKEFFERVSVKYRQVWLFFDRYDKADDNGEVLFEYVCKQKIENVDAIFIIAEDSPDYLRLSRLGKVVPAFSKEHKLLLLLADYIFTSQLNGFIENPFGKSCEFYRDLYHNAKIVFLQHGVTKDDQSKWLHRYKQNIYSIVVSSPMEKADFDNANLEKILHAFKRG